MAGVTIIRVRGDLLGGIGADIQPTDDVAVAVEYLQLAPSNRSDIGDPVGFSVFIPLGNIVFVVEMVVFYGGQIDRLPSSLADAALGEVSGGEGDVIHEDIVFRATAVGNVVPHLHQILSGVNGGIALGNLGQLSALLGDPARVDLPDDDGYGGTADQNDGKQGKNRRGQKLAARRGTGYFLGSLRQNRRHIGGLDAPQGALELLFVFHRDAPFFLKRMFQDR